MEIAEEKTVNDIAKIVMLVADNPQAGGIIVLLNNNQAFHNRFLQMGKPWKLDKEIEDQNT